MKVDKHAVGGFGGMIGRKKGAVAMYINFSGIRMVFVACHLAGLVFIFRFMLLSISFVSTEIHTNTLLECSKYQSIIPSAIQLQTMKI
jgi:hypothetical protein